MRYDNSKELIEALQVGLPLEKPDVLLKWGLPLGDVAAMSSGFLHSDRYFWPSVTLLQGLTHPMMAMNFNGTDKFSNATVLVGLESGLWSDERSTEGYKEVYAHLLPLLGQPTEIDEENSLGDKSVTWELGEITVFLHLFEQFIFKCYLTISNRKYKTILDS